MRALAAFVRIMDWLAEWTGRFAAWSFFAVGLFICYEVFMRYVLTMPTIWVNEVSRIIQVWGVFIAIAYVLRHRSHIVIDIAFREPGTTGRKLADTFAMLVIIATCVVIAVGGWEIWLHSTLSGHTTDSSLAVPKVFTQSALWVGFGLIALQAAAEIVKIWTGIGPSVEPDELGAH